MTKKKEEYYKISKSQFDEIKRFIIYANHSFGSIVAGEIPPCISYSLNSGFAELSWVLSEMANIEYGGLEK
jgi:hypothetical protein